MTAQAFAVGDRVEITGPTTIGSVLGYPHAALGKVLEITLAGLFYVEDLESRRTFYFPASSLQAIPAPPPPTEDVLSELLAEQRKTNDLLTQLLSKPTLTLHGQERDWQAQDEYSGSLACRVAARHGTPATDPFRPNRGPQAEM